MGSEATSQERAILSHDPAPRPAFDLSHEIVDGMVTHPGIPGPVITTFLTHEASAGR
jgi:hypothetical protein